MARAGATPNLLSPTSIFSVLFWDDEGVLWRCWGAGEGSGEGFWVMRVRFGKEFASWGHGSCFLQSSLERLGYGNSWAEGWVDTFFRIV